MPIVNEYDYSYATVDNNQKVDDDAVVANACALQADEDEFGAALDGVQWTQFLTTCTQNEAANLLTYNDTNPGGGSNGQTMRDGIVQIGDYDFYVKFNPTNAGIFGYVGAVGLWLMKKPRDLNNYVQLRYRARSAAGSQMLSVVDVVNTVTTVRYNVNRGTIDPIWLRIKRVGQNMFSYYIATADPVPTPANWQLLGTWQARSVGIFDETDDLTPSIIGDKSVSGSGYTQSAEYFRQWTGDIVAQLFWNDSPEIRVIAGVGLDYAVAAPPGESYNPRFFCESVNTPGISTIKYRVGYSANGLEGSVTWVDVAWQTAAQVCANAAAGNYDAAGATGRYIHVRAQFNSAGSDQPRLDSIELSQLGQCGEHELQIVA